MSLPKEKEYFFIIICMTVTTLSYLPKAFSAILSKIEHLCFVFCFRGKSIQVSLLSILLVVVLQAGTLKFKRFLFVPILKVFIMNFVKFLSPDQ